MLQIVGFFTVLAVCVVAVLIWFIWLSDGDWFSTAAYAFFALLHIFFAAVILNPWGFLR